MSSSISPDAKRRRFGIVEYLKRNTKSSLARLPFETILDLASFLEPKDAWALACQEGVLVKASECLAYWEHVAWNVDLSGVPNEIIASLLNTEPRMETLSFMRTQIKIWIQYALSRSKALSQRLHDMPKNVGPAVPYRAMLETRVSEGIYYCPPSRYPSKTIGAYSFLLEMEKVSENKKCTVFLENIETDSSLELYDDCRLSFRIPDKHIDEYFPWADDYEADIDERNLSRLCFLDTTFTVYAIDRSSGKHAKVYHSGRAASLFDGWEFCLGLGQCCSHATTNPIPHLQGVIKDPWKEDEPGKYLDLCLLLWDNDTRSYDEDNHIDDMLLFLEKECVYV